MFYSNVCQNFSFRSDQSLSEDTSAVQITSDTEMVKFAAVLTQFDRRFFSNTYQLTELILLEPTMNQLSLLDQVFENLNISALNISSSLNLSPFAQLLQLPHSLSLSGDFPLSRQLGQILSTSNQSFLSITKSLHQQTETNGLKIQKLQENLEQTELCGYKFEDLQIETGFVVAESFDEFIQELSEHKKLEELSLSGFQFTTVQKLKIKRIRLPILIVQDVEETYSQLRSLLSCQEVEEVSIQNLGTFKFEMDQQVYKSEVLRSDVFQEVEIGSDDDGFM
ncbi:Hypothetical_protein [Hexamita inflata]|uniref:Hypothetical_protein n=1 Tax=Hexamita inflata TaxID=28002 RepID=A0AA86V046_9EUKA|nr:Hypothetical protein HINF_LOCUS58846 [Hexamita inflata]